MEEDASPANGDDINPTTSSSSSMASLLRFGRRDGAVRRRGEAEDDSGRVDVAESPKRGGTLLLGVANVGGSLTVLLQIALVAWGVRQLRSMLARRKERFEDVQLARVAAISPLAVRTLVELDAVPHFLFDVRETGAAKERPAPFESALNIPESELKASLQLSELEWKRRFPSASRPSQNDFIVFLSSNEDQARRAASVAANLGYSGSVLSGGIDAYVASLSNHVDVPLKFLSRDAVAVLLGKQETGGSNSIHLLDVRRPDEVSKFGQIRGSKNIPVVELPKAFKLDKTDWESTYHFPKFLDDDIVIFQCRGSGRATWAAQLAQDAGLKHCFVYRDGSFGWRLDPIVLAYDSFQLGETIPESINFEVEKVNYEAAEKELQQLGLA